MHCFIREEEKVGVLWDLKNFPDHIYYVSEPLHGVRDHCEINERRCF